jgi:hypothetical protein
MPHAQMMQSCLGDAWSPVHSVDLLVRCWEVLLAPASAFDLGGRGRFAQSCPWGGKAPTPLPRYGLPLVGAREGLFACHTHRPPSSIWIPLTTSANVARSPRLALMSRDQLNLTGGLSNHRFLPAGKQSSGLICLSFARSLRIHTSWRCNPRLDRARDCP